MSLPAPGWSPDRLFGPGRASGTAALPKSEGSRPRSALPVHGGAPRHLAAHLLRLAAGASALGQPVDWLLDLQAEIEIWLAEKAVPGVGLALRMVLHLDQGLLAARLEPLPAPPQPYRLAVMAHPLGARRADPLVPHKGLSGPWWVEVLGAVRPLGVEDALLLWPDGTLAETAIASVGVELAGTLTLPPAQGRVASLAERLDLPSWAETRHLKLVVAGMSLAQARQGQVWCMNALRGIWPAMLL